MHLWVWDFWGEFLFGGTGSFLYMMILLLLSQHPLEYELSRQEPHSTSTPCIPSAQCLFIFHRLSPSNGPRYPEYLHCQHNVTHPWRTSSTDLNHHLMWIITCCPYLYTRHKTIMPVPRQESAHHKLKKKTLQWNKIIHMLYNNTPFFYFLKDHSLNNYFNDFYFLLSSTQQAR